MTEHLSDGQHRHGEGWRINKPTKANCFFCMKDRICKVVVLPEESKKNLLAKRKNPTLDKIVAQAVQAQYWMCDECAKKGGEFFAKQIVEHIFSQYEIKRRGL